MPKTGWRKLVCKNGHDRTNPDNLYRWGGYDFCKLCRGVKNSSWHKEVVNSEKSDSYRLRKLIKHLERTYNISLDQYHAMYENQDFLCKICGEESDLVVDHCHTTGKVRGLLCNQCNFVLGNSKDSVEVLRSAADYLERYDVGS